MGRNRQASPRATVNTEAAADTAAADIAAAPASTAVVTKGVVNPVAIVIRNLPRRQGSKRFNGIITLLHYSVTGSLIAVLPTVYSLSYPSHVHFNNPICHFHSTESIFQYTFLLS